MGSHDAPFAVQLLSELCEECGIMCVSAGYRKAPENFFPACKKQKGGCGGVGLTGEGAQG